MMGVSSGRRYVYLVECDIYESRYISGVYTSLKEAQDREPGKYERIAPWIWWNGKDFDKCVHILRYVLKGGASGGDSEHLSDALPRT